MSFSKLIFEAAEKPAGKWAIENASGFCATCAAKIDAGVSIEHLTGDAFSRQSNFLTFGDFVCEPCAWLYSNPKSSQRNLIAAGKKLWFPMISADSATEERPQWLKVLNEVAQMPNDTPVAGVLTTDPKPRLFPMMQLTSRDQMGMYLHCPDYDVSEFRMFDLDKTIRYAGSITQLLTVGFTKTDCFYGLLRSKLAHKNPNFALDTEAKLKKIRLKPEFLPALLIAQKEAK